MLQVYNPMYFVLQLHMLFKTAHWLEQINLIPWKSQAEEHTFQQITEKKLKQQNLKSALNTAYVTCLSSGIIALGTRITANMQFLVVINPAFFCVLNQHHQTKCQFAQLHICSETYLSFLHMFLIFYAENNNFHHMGSFPRRIRIFAFSRCSYSSSIRKNAFVPISTRTIEPIVPTSSCLNQVIGSSNVSSHV